MTILIDGIKKWWCIYNTEVSIDIAHWPQYITEMNAVVILSLVAAVVAEAPYNLPRPGPQAPAFNYQPAPAPPQFIPQPQVPQQQSNGYNYQRPSQPNFVQSAPAPQPQYYQPIVRPAPQPLPVYSIQHQPQPIQYQPQPIQYQPQPIQQQYYPQPNPQPNYIPQTVAPQPQPGYQPQPILPPSTSYGIPQLPAPVQPIRPLPAIIPQPQPAPIQYYQQQQQQQQQQVQQVQQQVQQVQQQLQQVQQQQLVQQQPQVSQGYSYPQAQPAQYPHLSLQSQQSNSAVSSYQSDSFQYNNAQQSQIHGDALDDTVVSRVQNIIKDSEHSSAKDAGYLSLVSGVSLGKATPSVEVLSFVHNSPVSGGSSQSSQASVQAQNQSSDYSLPSDAIRSGFVPQDKPATSYGVPN